MRDACGSFFCFCFFAVALGRVVWEGYCDAARTAAAELRRSLLCRGSKRDYCNCFVWYLVEFIYLLID